MDVLLFCIVKWKKKISAKTELNIIIGQKKCSNLRGQVGLLGVIKCLAQDPLFDPVAGHLEGRVQVHDVLDELPVQKGNPGLKAPRHCRLVRPQAVVLVQVSHLQF
jgi:hypothetical protein